MNDYLVLKAYGSYNVNDVVSLNDRQAKYLAMSGLIKLKPAVIPAKEPSKKADKAD